MRIDTPELRANEVAAIEWRVESEEHSLGGTCYRTLSIVRVSLIESTAYGRRVVYWPSSRRYVTSPVFRSDDTETLSDGTEVYLTGMDTQCPVNDVESVHPEVGLYWRLGRVGADGPRRHFRHVQEATQVGVTVGPSEAWLKRLMLWGLVPSDASVDLGSMLGEQARAYAEERYPELLNSVQSTILGLFWSGCLV